MINPCEFCEERRVPAFASLVLVLIGVVLGMVLMTLIRMNDRPPVMSFMTGIDCRLCHMPKLRTYRAYVEYHDKMRADGDLLAELVKP